MTLSRSKVFADAFYWIGIVNPHDEWHRAALEAHRSLHRNAVRVTTHEVFIEVFAAVSRSKILRRLAVEAYRSAKLDPSVVLVSLTEDLFERGVHLYEVRPDKSYSLVDCISMEVMRNEGITEVLTNDHHFEQEGFTLLIQ